MTTCAYREVVISKCSLPVMTAHTTKRACRRVMIERLWCGHFITAHAMTGFTTQTLIPIVLFVTEADLEGAGHLVRTDVAPEFMAHAAGRNVAIAGVRLWAMTLKAGRVRTEANGDRQ